MRVIKRQALTLHNEAVKIREQLKEIASAISSVPETTQDEVMSCVEAIYESLDKQQDILSYFLNGVPIKPFSEQEGTPEIWESALVDELDISDAAVRMLKRNDIFSINSLVTYLQTRSLTDFRGCGEAKAEKIEEALERYLGKQNKEERREKGEE